MVRIWSQGSLTRNYGISFEYSNGCMDINIEKEKLWAEKWFSYKRTSGRIFESWSHYRGTIPDLIASRDSSAQVFRQMDDVYGLPRYKPSLYQRLLLVTQIDHLVESTVIHELLCFLDAYQEYHQIPWPSTTEKKWVLSLLMEPFAMLSCP